VFYGNTYLGGGGDGILLLTEGGLTLSGGASAANLMLARRTGRGASLAAGPSRCEESVRELPLWLAVGVLLSDGDAGCGDGAGIGLSLLSTYSGDARRCDAMGSF
jgi:hypothetical protein